MSTTSKTDTAAALAKLTPQRRKFVLAYCDTFNATKAALAAGYSKKTARTQGSQLLTILDIKAAVKAIFDKASMDPAEIAARWTNLARAGLDDFYTKEEYEEAPKVEQPLAEYIAEKERQFAFEEKVAQRQKLSDASLLHHISNQAYKRNEIIRLQVELEENPNATRTIDGQKVKAYRMRLDMVKAADLGLFDLVKSISYGEFGPKLELRSPDAALDNLAKWQGMLTTKVDITSGGEPIAQNPLLGVLTLEQKKQLLEAKRKAQEGQPDAQ